jgi:DNA-binding NarL/FixJ family response regulator
MPAPLNIILIDDHPLLRLGVAGYINQEEGLSMTAQLANAAELHACSPPDTRPM